MSPAEELRRCDELDGLAARLVEVIDLLDLVLAHDHSDADLDRRRENIERDAAELRDAEQLRVSSRPDANRPTTSDEHLRQRAEVELLQMVAAARARWDIEDRYYDADAANRDDHLPYPTVAVPALSETAEPRLVTRNGV